MSGVLNILKEKVAVGIKDIHRIKTCFGIFSGMGESLMIMRCDYREHMASS